MRAACALLLLLPLAACGPQTADPVTKCMFQVKPEGSYEYGSGAYPVVTPGQGGTQAGADAINACVAARRDGAPAPATPAPQSAAALPQSTTERYAEDGTTVRSYTYGTPPASKTPATPVAVTRGSYESAGCPAGVNGLYRGTLLCRD